MINLRIPDTGSFFCFTVHVCGNLVVNAGDKNSVSVYLNMREKRAMTDLTLVNAPFCAVRLDGCAYFDCS